MYAMNKEVELKEWVKDAKNIQVNWLKGSTLVIIGINETVSEIKEVLAMLIDIPIDKQKLFPVMNGKFGTELHDTDNIKHIMNKYGTRNFHVYRK